MVTLTALLHPGVASALQAANEGWNIFHMDLKTAFLQGEAYDQTRDIMCQIPPEMGYPPHIGARVKKPAYGLNDAPRRWWNILGSATDWCQPGQTVVKSHDFLLEHIVTRHKKIINMKRMLHELVDSWHCYRKRDP